jgi:mannose-1-phosphate guanylyltransferase
VEVDDTSAYGVVVLDADGMVEAFVEKPRPEDAPARTVNAGMYVMSRTAIERYPAGRLSFERVVFPDLAARDALGGVVIEGRWMDIGTPDLYLDCTGAVLRGETALYRPAGPHLCDGEMAGDTAGAWSWVAAGASVAAGAVIEEAVVLAGARIGTNSVIRHAVVGWDAVVGSDVLIGGGAMVGRAARIGAGTELGYGIRIAPAATIGPGDVTFSPPK